MAGVFTVRSVLDLAMSLVFIVKGVFRGFAVASFLVSSPYVKKVYVGSYL